MRSPAITPTPLPNVYQKRQGIYLTITLLVFSLTEMALLVAGLVEPKTLYLYGFFSLMLITIAISYWRTRRWLNAAQTVMGYVAGHKEVQRGRSRYDVYDIRFEILGQVVAFELYHGTVYSVLHPAPVVGEPMGIVYNPANPYDARPTLNRWAPVWLWVVMAGVFTSIGTVLYYTQ